MIEQSERMKQAMGSNGLALPQQINKIKAKAIEERTSPRVRDEIAWLALIIDCWGL